MKKNLAIAAILGLIGVILGAFAAHALKERLPIEAMKSIETAILYQMLHVLTVLFVNGFENFSEKSKNTISAIMFAGILLFSGSIYMIHLLGVPASSIWFITPIGGLLLVCGWIVLFFTCLKISQKAK